MYMYLDVGTGVHVAASRYMVYIYLQIGKW